MKFIATTPELSEDAAVHALFEHLKQLARGRSGYGYYKFPLGVGDQVELPEIVLIDDQYGVCALLVRSVTLDAITDFGENSWTVAGVEADSPLIMLDDYITSLRNRVQRYRHLRNKVEFNFFLVFPLIGEAEFIAKYPGQDTSHIIFSNVQSLPYESFWPAKSHLGPKQSELFISVMQGAGRLNDYKTLPGEIRSDKVGEAITLLDSKIRSLDKTQHAAAIQIPDGPQRLRGLAGTGKTVILTMRAAMLHSRYPDRKILYTFHTQSLYNQIRSLITKFFRDSEEHDPDWSKLVVMHSFGGSAKEGVYTRTCKRNSIPVIRYQAVRFHNEPLATVCTAALRHSIAPEFDYILVDESQDLPAAFFRLLWEIATDPKRIMFAYDELQSLANLNIADTGDLFGYNADGTKRVDFSRGTYGHDIEMDYVLERSYRNPLDVLMLAHGIGLGIYNKSGQMQMISDRSVWNAIGYDVEGELAEGNEITIKRRPGTAVSLVHETYSGDVPVVERHKFDSRQAEQSWIADRIIDDVNVQGVRPSDIVVISLSSDKLEERFFSNSGETIPSGNQELDSWYRWGGS